MGILHDNLFKAYRKQRLYFILAGIPLVCAVTLYLLAATLFGTLTSIAITAVISSLIWYLLNELAFCRLISMKAREVAKWLLAIGMYAGAFLAISMLVQGWIFGMTIYLAVLVLVTGTFLKLEVISLLNIVSVVVNRKRDTVVVQTER